MASTRKKQAARRRGRPPSEDTRSERIQVRYTAAEKAALVQLASHNGETLSDVVRRLTVRQLELVS